MPVDHCSSTEACSGSMVIIAFAFSVADILLTGLMLFSVSVFIIHFSNDLLSVSEPK